MRLVIFFVMSLVLVLGSPVLIQAVYFPTDYNNYQLSTLKDTNKDFCFSVVGDLHFGETKSQPYVYKYILTNTSDNDFVIVNGDFTHHGRLEEYEDYIKITNTASIPVITVLGNHDISANSNLYSEIFGKNYFSFTHNGYNFIILDSANYSIGMDQLDWLSFELNKPAIIITHTPILGAPNREFVDFKNSRLFLGTIKSNPLLMVIASHNHQIRKFTQDNVSYIITGSAGGEPKASYETICLPAK